MSDLLRLIALLKVFLINVFLYDDQKYFSTNFELNTEIPHHLEIMNKYRYVDSLPKMLSNF